MATKKQQVFAGLFAPNATLLCIFISLSAPGLHKKYWQSANCQSIYFVAPCFQVQTMCNSCRRTLTISAITDFNITRLATSSLLTDENFLSSVTSQVKHDSIEWKHCTAMYLLLACEEDIRLYLILIIITITEQFVDIVQEEYVAQKRKQAKIKKNRLHITF